MYRKSRISCGIIKHLWYEKRKLKDETQRAESISDGVLYASGMIAGEGLVGILLAIFAVFGIGDKINLTNYGISLGNIGGCVFFTVLVAIMIFATKAGGKKMTGNGEHV